ncbi:MAG: indolepyruvate oxidoreductase subunit beta [Candidatus Lokiarchaeota archaeon]
MQSQGFVKEKDMTTKAFNILNVGVGGQGIISATQILAWAAMRDNYQVRTAETHGMAQRGGSVSSFLRFGKNVEGPLIPKGLTDILLAFETSEALRYAEYAGSETYIFINKKFIYPPGLNKNKTHYPETEEIVDYLNNITDHVYVIDASEIALKAGNSRTLNVVMLGVISGLNILPISKSSLEESIYQFVPSKAKEVNHIAFKLGVEQGKSLGGN